MLQSFLNIKRDDILFIHDLKNQVVYRGKVLEINEVNDIISNVIIKALQEDYELNSNFVLKLNHATDTFIVNDDETAIAYYDMERPITKCMKNLDKAIVEAQNKQLYIEKMVTESLEAYKKLEEKNEKVEEEKNVKKTRRKIKK